MKKNIQRCAECGKTVESEKIVIIDNRPLCLTCIYGKIKPFKIYPIGQVRNELKRNEKDFGLSGKKIYHALISIHHRNVLCIS